MFIQIFILVLDTKCSVRCFSYSYDGDDISQQFLLYFLYIPKALVKKKLRYESEVSLITLVQKFL